MIERGYDLLLEYLTALGNGSWGTFKAAVRTITDARAAPMASPGPLPTTVANHLSALGHVEFAFEDGTLDWQVAPATIAITRAGYGVLCGGRDSRTIEAIEVAAREVGGDVHSTPQAFAPATVEVHASSPEALAAIAAKVTLRKVALRIEADAGQRLIQCAPTITSMCHAAPEHGLPHGYDIEHFDAETLAWLPVDRAEGDGSFSFDCYRPEFRIVQDGVARKVSRSVAVYHALAAAGKSVIQYDESTGELCMPWQAFPPALHARALVLFSGRVPAHSGNALRFASVPHESALLLQRKLLGE